MLTEEDLNAEELSKWYFEQISIQKQKVKSQSSYLFGGIKFILYSVTVLLILLFLELLFVFYFDDSNPKLNRFITTGFGVIFVYYSLAWFIYVLAWEKINLFSLMKRKKQIFQIPSDRATDLKQKVFELATKMQIDKTAIIFWGIINKDNFPSIEEEQGVINILIPLNFIKFFEENPKEGEAIITHELGHVLQEDTKLYLITDTYFDLVRKILFPGTVINLILHLGIILSTKNLPFLILNSEKFSVIVLIILSFDISLIAYLNNGFTKLRATRRISEKLADTASVIFSSGDALIKALLTATSSPKINNKNPIHPQPTERIENINHLLNLPNHVNKESAI